MLTYVRVWFLIGLSVEFVSFDSSKLVHPDTTYQLISTDYTDFSTKVRASSTKRDSTQCAKNRFTPVGLQKTDGNEHLSRWQR